MKPTSTKHRHHYRQEIFLYFLKGLPSQRKAHPGHPVFRCGIGFVGQDQLFVADGFPGSIGEESPISPGCHLSGYRFLLVKVQGEHIVADFLAGTDELHRRFPVFFILLAGGTEIFENDNRNHHFLQGRPAVNIVHPAAGFEPQGFPGNQRLGVAVENRHGHGQQSVISQFLRQDVPPVFFQGIGYTFHLFVNFQRLVGVQESVVSCMGLDYIFPTSELLGNIVAADQPAMKTIFNVDDENLLAAENWLKNYTANTDTALDYLSKVILRQSFDGMINMYRLVGGVLCAILALIGILNFINSMTTSILSRHKEIAMLQSVGMTGQQVKQMLIYEGIGYSALGLLCSLILSVAGSLTVVRMMGAELSYFTWHFTLLPVILCIIPLILITAFVPIVCYNKMAQKTVVERLRIAE